MTKLTTHCLDTFSGKPAKGVKVDVYFVSGNREKLNSTTLNNNGRSDKPLIEGTNFKEGEYELVFFIGDYFKKITDLPKTPFLNEQYKKKFGFPFILAVKGKNKNEILDNFKKRISFDPTTEFDQAIKQVKQIASLRLKELNNKGL